MKMVQSQDDWPSILNIVLAGIQNNGEELIKMEIRLASVEAQNIAYSDSLALMKE